MRNNLLSIVIVLIVMAVAGSLSHRLPQVPSPVAPSSLTPSPTVQAEISLHGVHLGMTEGEVQAVLQRKHTHRFDVPKFASYELTWRYPDWMVSAMFQNGRVKTMSGYSSDLVVGSKTYPIHSSFDTLDHELGPGAPVGPQSKNQAAGGWVQYPRYHLKVAYNGEKRTISGFSVGEWGLNAGNHTL